MGKLHELLAVEEDHRGKATKIVNESSSLFKNKQVHFIEQLVTFKPIAENDSNRVEGHLAMTTTVMDKLDYISKTLIQYYDVVFQKEKTNTKAKADIVLPDGTVFLKDVPATALLALEKELNKIVELYNSIPTLEPGTPWNLSPEKGDNIYITKDSKIRTKKTTKPVVLYEATKEHPAQVKEVNEDVPVGSVETTVYSSKLTSKSKSELLDRLNNLKTSIKKARMRANSENVPSVNIGNKIFAYINEGKII